MWNMELDHDLTFWESKRAGRLATVDIFFSGASSPSSGGGVKKLRPSEDGAGGGVSGAVVLYIVPRAG